MHDSIGPGRVSPQRSLLHALAWPVAALGCFVFGVMAIEFALTLNTDRPGWWALLQAKFTGDAYTFGPGSAYQMIPIYRRVESAMISHTLLGGLALGGGLLQFVPALRRRYRMVHRASGVLVILAVVISMSGALTYLARTPLGQIYASPGFGLSLWALALVALVYVALAMLALWRRDFRSHMGFMALLMSALLTAPVLRVEWAAFGTALPLGMDQINQGVVSFLALTTTLMMALWMQQVGNRDLPLRARVAVFPAPLIRILAGLAIAVLIHEMLLAPGGFDLLAGWRLDHERWSPWSAAWAVPMVALLIRVPREIEAGLAGRRPTRTSEGLAGLGAFGALLLAVTQVPHSVDAIGLKFFWLAYAVISGGLVLAGRRAAPDGAEPWSLFWLFLTLTPALWPVLYGVSWASGQSFTVGLWLACTIGTAVMAANAFLTAFAIRLPFGRFARRG